MGRRPRDVHPPLQHGPDGRHARLLPRRPARATAASGSTRSCWASSRRRSSPPSWSCRPSSGRSPTASATTGSWSWARSSEPWRSSSPGSPRASSCSARRAGWRAPRRRPASRRSWASWPSPPSATRALRGRAVARFEAATLAGLGGGIVAAGVVYTALGNVAFFANAVLYGVSWCIYRFGISDPRVDHGGREHERRTTLAPLLGDPARRPRLAPGADLDRDQRGHRAVDGAVDLPADPRAAARVRRPAPHAGLLAAGGQRRPGRRDADLLRRARLLGQPVQAAAADDDHRLRDRRRRRAGRGGAGPQPRGRAAAGCSWRRSSCSSSAASSSSPARRRRRSGLLADMSEPYPRDRGAIMGLYSVFLAVGQIIGSLVGGRRRRRPRHRRPPGGDPARSSAWRSCRCGGCAPTSAGAGRVEAEVRPQAERSRRSTALGGAV